MSAADLHDLELIWPSLGPADVIVTGTFDQWSSSIHLVKGEAGFVTTVKVPWGQKIAYKFIVDGHWRCRDDHPQEDDGNGNINNVLQMPEKPELVAVHDPPARLSIPLNGAPSQGYGDIENMVTAVEYLPPAEPAAIRGSLPLPTPQITVEGLDQVPSPVNESKVNTAAATEGNVSPASVTPAAEVKQTSSSRDVSILPFNDNGSVLLPPINGNGEAFDGFMTHMPIQFTKGEFLTSPAVPETAEEVVVTPLESAVPQPGRSPQTAQVNAPLVAVLEPTVKHPEVVLLETVAQGHRQRAAAPASNGQASLPSTPASSTLAPKKRRSLFARIKHIFDKDKDKQERKERHKH